MPGSVVSEGTTYASSTVEFFLDDLRAHDLGCAPHVAARLIVDLHAHLRTIREMAATLTPAQRQGLESLPTPLPAVPAIREAFGDREFAPRDRDLLLAISVGLDDDLDSLLAFDGRSAEEIAGEPVGTHLSLHAGRVRLVDQRLAIWLCQSTAPLVIASVHRRLHEVFRARAQGPRSDWHRARASLSGEADAAPELIRMARALCEAGDVDRALLLAREAVAHAHGAQLDEARAAAGAAAVGAGYAEEAAALLGELFPYGSERSRLRGLAGLLLAQAHVHGVVPEPDPASCRPRTDDARAWRAWARAAALAAPLCAERGDRRGARAWVGMLREASTRIGADTTLRDSAIALSWLLLGERDAEGERDAGPVSGVLLHALRAALDGDIDRGIRLLAHDAAMGAGTDPLIEGFERSPLLEAYRAVLHVLLLLWRGDVSAARDRLIRAALTVPIAQPFAGLGVVLARRLDLAVLGEIGPFAHALTDALPAGIVVDTLMDRGIRSFLTADFAGAAGAVRLWSEIGSPQPTLAVPGLDEVAATADAGARRGVAPPELERADSLLRRITAATEARWRAEHDDVRSEARTLRSPFARARVESMLGTQSAIRGDLNLAKEHLVTAQSLFELCGALAWARSVADRIARLDAEDAPTSDDALSVCRRAWAQRLTSRELEVAMLAVGGASNRDIAEALIVSVRTVEVHLGRVFVKLGARNRVELMVLARRTGQHL